MRRNNAISGYSPAGKEVTNVQEAFDAADCASSSETTMYISTIENQNRMLEEYVRLLAAHYSKLFGSSAMYSLNLSYNSAKDGSDTKPMSMEDCGTFVRIHNAQGVTYELLSDLRILAENFEKL